MNIKIIKTLQFFVYYSNAIITVITAILFALISFQLFDPSASFSNSLMQTFALFYSLLFASFSIWVFSLGALVMLTQLIYGLVNYFKRKDNETAYFYHLSGAVITLAAYVVIFMLPTPSS